MTAGTILIVGGTRGLGRHLAERLARDDRPVVIAGCDGAFAQSVALQIGGATTGVAIDLAEPRQIARSLAGVGVLDHIVLARGGAGHQHRSGVRPGGRHPAGQAEADRYTEVLHCLHSRMHADSSVLLFGGLAKDRPYPGSTTVTSVNGAVTTMVRAFATELAPVRVNAIHPGIVGDSPNWINAAPMPEQVRARTPTGRLVTMADVTDAALFLLRNPAVNGINLAVDAGWMML